MENSDATAAVTADDPNSGFIRFEVEDVSTLGENGRYSPKIEFRGLPWRANARINHELGEAHLSVFLVNWNRSPLWSADVTATFTLINLDRTKNISGAYLESLDSSKNGSGCIYNELIWGELMDEEKGFVKDDKLVVEVAFTVKGTTGVRSASQIDFTDPNEPFHDVALIIEGEKFYASKQILAVHSPFFKAMFYGNFDEKNKKEIEVKEVDRNEFHEMLRVIYPIDRKITDETVKFLLRLGDRFQIKFILDLAENHLIFASGLNRASKFLLSDQFRLAKLQDHCLGELYTLDDLNKIKESPEYDYLSPVTKAAMRKMI